MLLNWAVIDLSRMPYVCCMHRSTDAWYLACVSVTAVTMVDYRSMDHSRLDELQATADKQYEDSLSKKKRKKREKLRAKLEKLEKLKVNVGHLLCGRRPGRLFCWQSYFFVPWEKIAFYWLKMSKELFRKPAGTVCTRYNWVSSGQKTSVHIDKLIFIYLWKL